MATWWVYILAPQPFNANGGDNLWYVPTAMSLVHHGTLDVSGYRTDLSQQNPLDVWITAMDADPRLTSLGTERVNWFPIGPTLMVVPLVPLERLFSDVQSPLRRAFRIARIAAATTATLSALMVLALVQLSTGNRPLAWSLTAFHAFASPHFSTHHSAFWSHNPIQLMYLTALILLVWRGSRYVWLAGLPLALAYATRPDAAIVIAMYSLCVLVRFRSAVVGYSLLLGLGLGAFFLWSHGVYGSWRPPYYSLIPGTPLFDASAFAGALVSPNRGLFIFTPVYLLSVAGAFLVCRRPGDHHVIYHLSLLTVVGQWVAIAVLNPIWWGGFSYGPRLFAPVLPMLTVLLIPAVERMRNVSAATGRTLRLLVAAALVWSLFVQVRGSVAAGPTLWNYEPNVDLHRDQIWNWSDLQIFR